MSLRVKRTGSLGAAHLWTTGSNAYATAVLANSPIIYARGTFAGSFIDDYAATSFGTAHNIDVLASGTAPTANTTDGPRGPWSISWGTSAGCIRTNYSFATTTFTVECWVKFPSSQTGGAIVVTSPSSGSSGQNFGLNLGSDGSFNAYAWNGSTESIGPTAPFSPNVWHHVVYSIGAAGQKIRVNKSTVATGARTSVFNQTNNLWLRGFYSTTIQSSSNQYQISELAFYPTQLSDVQTDAHYDTV